MARLEGIHRQKSKLADGSVRQYHYAWRGGPCFWKSDSDIREGSDAYLAALDQARRRTRGGGLMTPDMVDQFFDSAEFLKLDTRTQSDYRIWGGRLAEEFREDQATLFTYDEARTELLRWRDKWAYSPKLADMAIVTAVRILNWAGPKGRGLIGRHTCEGIPRLYQGNRAEIIWSPEDIAKFEAGAPGWVVRALTTLVETGLRPGDAHRLSRNHIKATPERRRIQIRVNKGKKKNRFASIPVTQAMARVIDETPSDRLMILVRADGGPLTQRGGERDQVLAGRAGAVGRAQALRLPRYGDYQAADGRWRPQAPRDDLRLVPAVCAPGHRELRGTGSGGCRRGRPAARRPERNVKASVKWL